MTVTLNEVQVKSLLNIIEVARAHSEAHSLECEHLKEVLSKDNSRRIDLAVSFEPDAIREQFEMYPEEAPVRQFVQNASEDTLVDIGLDCLLSEELWELFETLLLDTVIEHLKKA